VSSEASMPSAMLTIPNSRACWWVPGAGSAWTVCAALCCAVLLACVHVRAPRYLNVSVRGLGLGLTEARRLHGSHLLLHERDDNRQRLCVISNVNQHRGTKSWQSVMSYRLPALAAHTATFP
jgi:hypothetical protein